MYDIADSIYIYIYYDVVYLYFQVVFCFFRARLESLTLRDNALRNRCAEAFEEARAAEQGGWP